VAPADHIWASASGETGVSVSWGEHGGAVAAADSSTADGDATEGAAAADGDEGLDLPLMNAEASFHKKRFNVRTAVAPIREKRLARLSSKAKAALEDAQRASTTMSGALGRLVRTHRRQEALLTCQLAVVKSTLESERARASAAAASAMAAHHLKDSSIADLRSSVEAMRKELQQEKDNAVKALQEMGSANATLEADMIASSDAAREREGGLRSDLAAAKAEAVRLTEIMDAEHKQHALAMLDALSQHSEEAARLSAAYAESEARYAKEKANSAAKQEIAFVVQKEKDQHLQREREERLQHEARLLEKQRQYEAQISNLGRELDQREKAQAAELAALQARLKPRAAASRHARIHTTAASVAAAASFPGKSATSGEINSDTSSDDSAASDALAGAAAELGCLVAITKGIDSLLVDESGQPLSLDAECDFLRQQLALKTRQLQLHRQAADALESLHSARGHLVAPHSYVGRVGRRRGDEDDQDAVLKAAVTASLHATDFEEPDDFAQGAAAALAKAPAAKAVAGTQVATAEAAATGKPAADAAAPGTWADEAAESAAPLPRTPVPEAETSSAVAHSGSSSSTNVAAAEAASGAAPDACEAETTHDGAAHVTVASSSSTTEAATNQAASAESVTAAPTTEAAVTTSRSS